jgi:hypothetical protein
VKELGAGQAGLMREIKTLQTSVAERRGGYEPQAVLAVATAGLLAVVAFLFKRPAG